MLPTVPLPQRTGFQCCSLPAVWDTWYSQHPSFCSSFFPLWSRNMMAWTQAIKFEHHVELQPHLSQMTACRRLPLLLAEWNKWMWINVVQIKPLCCAAGTGWSMHSPSGAGRWFWWGVWPHGLWGCARNQPCVEGLITWGKVWVSICSWGTAVVVPDSWISTHSSLKCRVCCWHLKVQFGHVVLWV